MTALFTNRAAVHSSVREQISHVERSIKACVEAMKKAYELLWKTQNERNTLEEVINQLKKSKANLLSTDLMAYQKQLAQMDCDLEYLKKDLEENKPEQVVLRLQERLEQLKDDQVVTPCKQV